MKIQRKVRKTKNLTMLRVNKSMNNITQRTLGKQFDGSYTQKLSEEQSSKVQAALDKQQRRFTGINYMHNNPARKLHKNYLNQDMRGSGLFTKDSKVTIRDKETKGSYKLSSNMSKSKRKLHRFVDQLQRRGSINKVFTAERMNLNMRGKLRYI